MFECGFGVGKRRGGGRVEDRKVRNNKNHKYFGEGIITCGSEGRGDNTEEEVTEGNKERERERVKKEEKKERKRGRRKK